MTEQMVPLALDDTFQFDCHNGVACFNECCRDLNQFLTPYDIMRLKQYLSISSGEFLATYTTQHDGPATGLPVVSLRFDRTSEKTCPFVTPNGCRVYAARPSSCRSYPVARMVTRSRGTGKLTEHFALVKEPHCLGFQQGKTQSVREWIAAQEIECYNRNNDLMMEIISLKNQLKPGPLPIRSKHLFHMACYDIDSFKTHILEQNIASGMRVDKDRIQADDEALLTFGYQFVKAVVFDVHTN